MAALPFARVLLVPQARGVVREVFQQLSKLHLTVGMMKLFSQREKVSKSTVGASPLVLLALPMLCCCVLH